MTPATAPQAWRIEPIREDHIEGFRAAVDAVARERRYLMLLEAPPVEGARDFVLGNLAAGNPQVVALAGGPPVERVVGWCDIVRAGATSRRHSGTLGMGVLGEWRGRGVGAALLRVAIALARERSVTRVELVVRADNTRARALYERFGFAYEGCLRRISGSAAISTTA